MKFQIEKLIVWPKNKAFAPREVRFRSGVVNVITGASRTGKSAIIPIIDYCLASSDCFIPIDTIRDYASWYGIIFQTSTEKMLIARRVPDGPRVSNDFFLLRGLELSVPPMIEEANETLNGVKLILNTIAATPFFSLGDDDDQNFKARLGFRDLMALVFQSQEIVANQNILFYKTHAHEHRERLRNWFPFILGAETLDVLKARHRLKSLDLELKRLRREFAEVKKTSDGWVSNILGHLEVASEYGLIQEGIPKDAGTEQLLAIAKNVLENIPDQSKSNASNIERANAEIASLEGKDEELSTAIGAIKKRLGDVQRLRSSFLDYGGGVKKRVDRLHISQWLRAVSKEASTCPACGSSGHPNAACELEEICLAFEAYEGDSKRAAEVPSSFDREEVCLKEELDQLLVKKRALQQRFDLLMSKDKNAQREFQKRKDMYLFLGHLKASSEVFERLTDGGDMQRAISDLEEERLRLSALLNDQKVEQLVKLAAGKIAQNMLDHLKKLDVEEKYRGVAPRFSISDLNISVLSNDGNWHFLAEVGSASNWVSFHLALMCGLQEFFLSQKTSVVPGFTVFDQPSQVYFPKLKKKLVADDEDPKYGDEDVNAVKSMFKTLADSVLESNGEWQAIVLDHADGSVYENIKGIFEVEEWRNGKKLIPEAWYADAE